MAAYTATVSWQRQGSPFTDNRYSRAHQWAFDGGAVVPASSSPQVVRVPMSDPAGVDPEEALVAALSSCHMLFFLNLAALQGLVVDQYHDSAVGHLGQDSAGRDSMTEVVLRPQVRFSGGRRPDEALVAGLHHQAHAQCYIANSVRCEVRTEGRWQHTD